MGTLQRIANFSAQIQNWGLNKNHIEILSNWGLNKNHIEILSTLF